MRIFSTIYLPTFGILAFRFYTFWPYFSDRMPLELYILGRTHLFTQAFSDPRFDLQSKSSFAESIADFMANFSQQLGWSTPRNCPPYIQQVKHLTILIIALKA